MGMGMGMDMKSTNDEHSSLSLDYYVPVINGGHRSGVFA